MGTKFANLNVKSAELATVTDLCPDCAVRSITPDWVTIAGELLESGTTQKEAKRLSKALPCPVVSTEYFDDDFVEFAVYRDGKRVARHIPAEYEGIGRLVGKPKAWAEVLGLPPEAEKELRAVFQSTNAEESLRLLECALDCPLWVDAEWIDDATLPDKQYLADYLAHRAAEKKLKNQTKLTLVDEVEGSFSGELALPLFQKESQTKGAFWEVDQTGHFRRMFQAEISGRSEKVEVSPGEGLFLRLFSAGEWDEERDFEPAYLYIFDDSGEMLACVETPEGVFPYWAVFLDQDRVLIDGVCWNFRVGRQEWQLDTDLWYGPPCCLPNGDLAFRGEERLWICTPEGSVKKWAPLPERCNWRSPVFWNEHLYLGAVSSRTFSLICYDMDLTERWRKTMPGGPAFQEPVLDETAGILYFEAGDGHMAAMELHDGTLLAIRDRAVGKLTAFSAAVPGVGVVVANGNSIIEVWDAGLKLISRHRANASNYKWLRRGGRLYLLTVILKDGGGGVCSRVYELRK